MSRNVQGLAVVVVALLGWLSTPAAAARQLHRARTDRPNVVILLADDLGYGDLGCYGHPTIRTPNLDRMATDGLKLTQFYAAAPVCTPSRAALLTGRFPVRSGLTHVLFPYSSGGLPADEITLAGALKTRGYSTFCVGKWHLGHHPEFLPTRHGFDHYFGLPYSNDMMSEGATGHDTPMPLMRDETVVESPADLATLTPRYTDEAVRFLREHGREGAKRGTPFFLYLPYTSPHTPLFSSMAQKGKSPRGLYGDAVEEIDASVGRILQTLLDEELAADTLVMFTSDNGPWLMQGVQGGSAGLLREGKGSTWEGGMREPCLVWWPGTVGPGRVSSDLACTMDWFVTAIKLAGAKVPSDRPIDGVSLVPVLDGSGPTPRQVMAYYNGETLAAVRKGPWKIHLVTVEASSFNPLRFRPETHNPPLLYHLEHDPSERFDLARDNPDVVADLLREANRLKQEVTPRHAAAMIANAATRLPR
jgi:arylsulfatase A